MSTEFPAKAIDKKYLSVFTRRFIPAWWMERYPNFEILLRTFLEFLEQDEHQYHNIANYDKYFDIDKIVEYKNSTDPVKQDLGNKLIDQVYKQYLGDANLRYISNLMDEVLYIKNQKNFLNYKGTKYSFMFFFLLIMGAFFRIYELISIMKRHDGRFRYDGIIRYGNSSSSWIEPFVFLVRSEYSKATYQNVLQILSPAGMYAYCVQDATNRTSIADSIDNAENYGDVYMAIYKDAALVKVIAATSQISLQVGAEDPYNIELKDYTFWKYMITGGTGINHIFYESGFNISLLTGEFNKVMLFRNCIYGGSPATELLYDTLPDSYTDMVPGGLPLLHSDNTNFQVVDYSTIGVMVEYT
jgi:hypothetical protein